MHKPILVIVIYFFIISISNSVFAGCVSSSPSEDALNRAALKGEAQCVTGHYLEKYSVGELPYHAGIDLRANFIPAYSIIEGTVRYASASSGKIIIRLSEKIDNKTVDVIYLHLSEVYVNKNSIVSIGQLLGKTGATGAPAHLHIEARTNYTGASALGFVSCTGGCDTPEKVKTKTIDPVRLINSSSAGIFDGAGSLINPTQNCWGCDRDAAIMHPHPGTGSTVVFQWLHNGDVCEFLDLYANKKTSVVIKSKGWSQHSTQRAFKTILSNSPVSFKKSADWTTFAITSDNSISEKVSITAYCKKPNDTFHQGSTETVAADLVDVTSGYYWTGTGSIISQANRTGFGVNLDVAATFKSKKSLTSFQWYASPGCTTLKISDGSSSHHSASVSTKRWNAKEFEHLCSSLPCRVSRPIGYHVIKVKSEANEFNGGTIKAECK